MNKIKIIAIAIIILAFDLNIFSQNHAIIINSKRHEDKCVELTYKKDKPGSYYLIITFSKLINARRPNYQGLITSDHGFVLKLRPINPEQNISYSYSYKYIQGNPKPRVDSLFVYTLPFNMGVSFKVNEESNINEKYWNKKSVKTWKSFSFYLNKADTVTSIRKGVVIDINNQFKSESSVNKNFTHERNSIIIEHADGTYASYKGFADESIFVELGQTVYPQTPLGILGYFDNKSNFRLSLKVYYKHYDNLKSWLNTPRVKRKTAFQYVNPYFYTSVGTLKLKNNTNYTVDLHEDLITKEFTRREKKKRAKLLKKRR